MSLNEHPEGWSVAVAGYELLTVQFSGRLSLTVYGEAGKNCTIALGSPFVLRTAVGAEHELDAEQERSHLVPVLALRHEHVSALIVSRDADLHLTFDSGVAIHARPDDHYENWEIVGPGELNLVSPLGGGDPRIRS
jgi:Family of unknown function (DUF6188)